jgi:hypothetical protein
VPDMFRREGPSNDDRPREDIFLARALEDARYATVRGVAVR